MFLSNICIRRPVFATVLSLIIVLLGLMFYSRLQIRGIPDVDPPIITIESNYHGADAAYMEHNVTSVIEKVLRTLKNVDHIESTTSSGSSEISIIFTLNTNIEEALNDVRSKITSVYDRFPKGMTAPTVSKMDADSWPSLWIVAQSNTYSDLELTDILYQNTVKGLEKINSVGKVQMFGARYYTMSIMPDPAVLYSLQIAPEEIESAIRSQNKDYPAGYIKTDTYNYILQLKGQLSSEEEFKNIIIRTTKDGIIKLGQIATVKIEPYDEDVILRYNGEKCIAIGLIKKSKANILELSDDVRKALPELQNDLSKGIKLNIAYDASVSVKESIYSVFFTIFEALILVISVMYLFLRSPKITIIPFVTIPVSLIGTISFMYACGFTINTFTLLAMTLAIGLVVDDAIVMLENIFRHHENGEKVLTASFKGADEIGFAIVAMTITLASVFLPIGFVEGFVGKIFIEFAWTLAFCVLVSGFVALTLTPMMASMMIGKDNHTTPEFLNKFHAWTVFLEKTYSDKLDWLLKHNKEFWIICISSIIVLIISTIFVNKVFSPEEDVSALRLNATGPEGSNIKQTSYVMDDADKVLSTHNDVLGYFTISSGCCSEANGYIILKPLNKRHKSQAKIRAEINKNLSQIPGMSISVLNPRSLASGNATQDIEFHIHSDGTWEDLDIISQQFLNQMRNSEIFTEPQKTLKTSIPTLDVVVNRDIAQIYGVSLENIGNTLQYLMSGREVGRFTIGDDTYEVTLRYAKDDKNKISDLNKIFLKNKDGKMLHLSAVAKINEKVSIKSYRHYDGEKSVIISASLNDDYKVSDAIKYIDNLADKIDIKEHNIHLDYLGEIKRMQEANNSMIITFGLALIFIYLVLSAQFESFKDPLIILCAVPFSITGGILALLLAFDSINLYSNIGLITLIGLITKNSIMIVEFTNQLLDKGYDLMEAIKQATKLRFRPILMTSMATICDSLPLIFGSGTGAEVRTSIGLVIVGGMLIGTFFTIFIIPCIYYKTHK